MSSNPISNGVQQSNSEPELTGEAYALLAQANLQRIRGNWLEATEMCMSAMRLVPGNVAAQSLLGDIYENQGCIDDAIQWYRMALDANPNSPADRQKLNKLLELKNNTTVYFDNSNITVQDNPKPAVAADGSRTLKYFAYSSAFIVMAIILLSVIQTRAQYSYARNNPNKSKNINTNPFYVNAPAPDTDTTSKENVVKDAGELTLSNSIRQADIPGNNQFKFVDAETDPRLGRLTLTYLYTHYPDETVTKDTLMRQSLRVIQSVKKLQETNSYAYITMRVLLGDYNGNIQITFIGDITRTDLINYAAEPASYSPEQITGAFSNQWWSNNIN